MYIHADHFTLRHKNPATVHTVLFFITFCFCVLDFLSSSVHNNKYFTTVLFLELKVVVFYIYVAHGATPLLFLNRHWRYQVFGTVNDGTGWRYWELGTVRDGSKTRYRQRRYRKLGTVSDGTENSVSSNAVRMLGTNIDGIECSIPPLTVPRFRYRH